MIIKPFNLELAKKISNGERKGEIITFGHNYKVELGEYEGKMWKANRGGIWYLYWYDHDDNPSMIKIERREILLLN